MLLSQTFQSDSSGRTRFRKTAKTAIGKRPDTASISSQSGRCCIDFGTCCRPSANKLVRHPTPQAENPGKNNVKPCFLLCFQWILGQNPFKNVPTIALIILHQSGAPPTTPNPFYNFYRFSYFYIFYQHQLPPSPPHVSYFLKESAPRTSRFELSVAS